jgi:hypothetical protein
MLKHVENRQAFRNDDHFAQLRLGPEDLQDRRRIWDVDTVLNVSFPQEELDVIVG